MNEETQERIDREELSVRAHERHEDLDRIHTAIAFGVKALTYAVLPMIIVGVWTLVAGYFQQNDLIKEQAKMGRELETISDKLEAMNQKVQVMWYAGHWDDKKEDKAE